MPSGLHLHNSLHGTFIAEGQFEGMQKLWLRLSFLKYTEFITFGLLAESVDVQKLDNNLNFPPTTRVVFLSKRTASRKPRLQCLLVFYSDFYSFYVLFFCS